MTMDRRRESAKDRRLEAYKRNKHLGPRLAGESVSEEVVKWWAERFPEIPSRVIQYMAGQDSIPQSQDLPWNHRLRRRFANTKGLIFHLFSAVLAATGEAGLRAFLGKSLHVGKAGSGGAALLNFP